MAQKLIEFIVKSIVSKPEVVRIERTTVEGNQFLRICVSSYDIARVIGSGGRVFRALRAVVAPRLPADIKDIVVDVVSE